MANWSYTFPVKDLFKEDSEDYDAVALEIAPRVVYRLEAFINRLEEKAEKGDSEASHLAFQLEDVLDQLKDIDENCEDPCEAFNDALAELYDIGDRGHMIWIK